jgi:hypothetical protein
VTNSGIETRKGKHHDVAAYALGVLADPAGFEGHLSGCARCRRELVSFGEVNGALAQAVRLGYLQPGDGAAQGREVVTAARPVGAAWRRRFPPTTAGLVLLLAVCLAAAAAIPAGSAVLSRWVKADAHMVFPARVVDDPVGFSYAGQEHLPRSIAVK